MLAKVANSDSAIDHVVTPEQCTLLRVCACYDEVAINAIANGIKAGQLCKAHLALANEYISKNKSDRKKWLEPSVVVGRVVVSFAVGSLVGYLHAKDR